MNKALFPVFGVVFVVALEDVDDDEFTVNVVLIKYNKQILYLEFIGSLLKYEGCTSYEAFVYLFKDLYDLVDPNKYRHSKIN